MSKAPSLQFYPGDWQRDTGLKMCSLAARGLWAEMMWLMFDGEPYGHLSVKGSVIPPDKLGVILGVDTSVVNSLLGELDKYGVFSRTKDGVIFSRRMVRDHKRRETNALNGGKGGNPKLRGKGSRLSKSVNLKDKREDIPLTADAIAVAEEVSSSEKERAGKILFSNSRYADPKVAAAELPDLVAKGVNIAAYAEKIRNWSDAKDERRTDRGWLATYKTFHAKDQERPPNGQHKTRPVDTAARRDIDTNFT